MQNIDTEIFCLFDNYLWPETLWDWEWRDATQEAICTKRLEINYGGWFEINYSRIEGTLRENPSA